MFPGHFELYKCSMFTLREFVKPTYMCCLSENLNISYNFCNIEDSNLIFGMHVYLMELLILSGERSRSSFKVRGQIYVAQIAYFMNTFAILKIAT